VQVLHPVISAVAPTGLSPNGDGRFDTTKVTYSLPESSAVSYSVTSQSTSLVVRGPVSLGVVGAGSRSFVWNGLDNAGHRVADGRYTVRLDTYRNLPGGEIARGSASRDVRVDDTVPSLAALVGSGATFYPYPDTYGDTWQPRITVGESATVSLEILNKNGAILRRVSAYHSGPGVVTLTWNGRTTSGAIVGAGTYGFRMSAEDTAGNRRVTAKYTVHVSAKRLIAKSATIRLNGNAGVVKSTDWSCSGASNDLSYFTKGVFLVNDCPDAQVILADYLVSLPAATRYNTLSISAYGNTDLAPERINGAWWNYPSATWSLGGFVGVNQNHRDAWSALGTVSATGRVSNRHAHVAVVVTSLDAPADYDIGLVSVTLHYQVLG
jgi:flagellar hook assembly protein FlgD